MKKLLILLSCVALVACDDFFEEDISGRSVQVIAPADSVAIAAGSVAFRWNRMSGVAGYRFVAVSPSFQAPVRMVADTLIYTDSLSRSYGCTLVLTEGDYAWSVTAFNSGYETRPEVRTLTVIPKQ